MVTSVTRTRDGLTTIYTVIAENESSYLLRFPGMTDSADDKWVAKSECVIRTTAEAKTFAVIYAPDAGPRDVMVVGALSRLAAIDAAVAFCKSVDMDAVDPADFSAIDLGFVGSLIVTKSCVDALDGFAVEGR